MLQNRSMNAWGFRIAVCVKLALLAGFVSLTNFGLLDRVALLFDNARWMTLIPFLLIWAVALGAVVAAAFQPHLWLRLLWGGLIAACSAVGWGYYAASKSDLTVFDILSLWNARHEAGRAADLYAAQINGALAILVGGVLLFAIPPAVRSPWLSRWFGRLALVPAVPVALIAGVVYLKSGGGSAGMPKQFAPAALSVVAAEKIATRGASVRRPVAWAADKMQAVPHLLFLVEESVRADYLDLKPGNPFTPELARLAPNFVDFGPAASGSNCSHYSNAILRFGAARGDLVRTLNTSSTIWQYAKQAGYRTVFIDAQASISKNPGMLQNFMTVAETRDIDELYNIQDVAPAEADQRMLDILRKELASDKPVFIYANKNGAHFPYDKSYPAERARFTPTVTQAGEDTEATRLASYRNAISWSVDRFFQRFFSEIELAGLTFVYTSDHGQVFNPGELTHCAVEDADPRQALVPLYAYTSNPALRARFEQGARTGLGEASHFTIFPTLLDMMGYPVEEVKAAYQESMFTAPAGEPAFTSGDILGLFSDAVTWNPVDLRKGYLEPAARNMEPQEGRAVSAAPEALE